MTRLGETVAVVPVRGLTNGKTRLAGVLDAEAREAVTRRMLRTVLCATLNSGVVDRVAVISPDATALTLARQIDTRVVAIKQEATTPGLNAAVTAGRDWAIGLGAERFLVLFGDLPLLSANEVQALAAGRGAVVLAPDRHGLGTNAMAIGLSAPGAAAFRFGFGPESLAHHHAEAERLALPVETFDAIGTAYDLDTPADLTIALGAGANVVTPEIVRERDVETLGIGDRR